jgi:hypothetical protein
VLHEIIRRVPLLRPVFGLKGARRDEPKSAANFQNVIPANAGIQ